MNVSGLIVGVVSFAAIGLFHPLVIKGEYHFGVKIWPVFAVLGIAFLAASCLVGNVCVSSILAVVGFCSLWSIGELFKQRERVKKGWFPRKPMQEKRHSPKHRV